MIFNKGNQVKVNGTIAAYCALVDQIGTISELVYDIGAIVKFPNGKEWMLNINSLSLVSSSSAQKTNKTSNHEGQTYSEYNKRWVWL